MHASKVDRIGIGRTQPKDSPMMRCLPQIAAAVAVVIGLVVAPFGLSASEEARFWSALKSGGHVVLMRHALAPGMGDPSEFALGDCSTQRNLSVEGRKQAARIGARFRANGLAAAQVLSSQWCRCLETAELLGLGPVEQLPVLNSFFQRPDRRNQQTEALKAWLDSQDLEGPLVLVTHQVNITALTGVYPASGEVVVVRRSANGEMTVVGSIETD